MITIILPTRRRVQNKKSFHSIMNYYFCFACFYKNLHVFSIYFCVFFSVMCAGVLSHFLHFRFKCFCLPIFRFHLIFVLFRFILFHVANFLLQSLLIVFLCLFFFLFFSLFWYRCCVIIIVIVFAFVVTASSSS